jgi:ferredoxin-NADP reductase
VPETRTKGKPYRRIAWRLGEVIEAIPETLRTKSLVLGVPGWEVHKSGQHVDAGLTAPTPLVEAVATALVDLGHDPTRVKTESFGPTGG